MKTNTQAFPEKWYVLQKNVILAFLFMFCLEPFISDYWEKTWIENQQLFDRIIDVTLFDGILELQWDVGVFEWNK